MPVQRHGPDPDTEALSRSLEAFSRDLLALVRALKVYPPQHPFLRGLATRLTAMVGRTLPGPLVLGVASRELALGSLFVGGKEPRAAELASHLHARRVLRLTWGAGATDGDAVGFAELLGERELTGDDLRRALQRRRIFAVDLEPLEIARIHDSFREGRSAAPRRAGGREAWQWLLSGEAAPEEIADLLSSDGFWETPWDADPGSAGGPKPAEVLFRLGERLAAALEHLPPGQRTKVLGRLARVGRKLSARELAGILGTAGAAGVLDGPLAEGVAQTFGGDRLVDLLAGLVDREGRNTRRLAEVYGRLAHGQASELLGAVKARLASPEQHGFTAEVWEAVEDFLLGVQEGDFMGDEYTSSLEALADAPETGGTPEAPDFPGDVEGNLDRVLLGLALGDPERWGQRLLDRIEDRMETLPARSLLALLSELDGGARDVLKTRPALLERVLRLQLERLRELDSGDRDELLAFGRAHEHLLLDAAVRALGEEESISSRRFLVDLTAGFSPAATPTLVSRIRSAPWYVSRNLAIALGRKGDDAAVPVLRSLLGHGHPKVRREAILALGTLGTPAAREALREAAGSRERLRDDRTLADRVLRNAKRGDAGR